MELRRYLYLLRQRMFLLVLTVVAGVAGGYVLAHRTPTYQAQTSIYVGSRQLVTSAASADALAAMDRLAQTFAAMIKSPPVAQGAVQTTHAQRSAAQVTAATTATVVPNTNLIRIAVTDTNPAVAQALADGVAQAFIAQVGSLEPGTGNGTSPAVSIFAPAALPASPQPNHEKKDMALGGLFGLTVAVAAVVLLEYLDVTARGASDLERRLGVPVLGVIPYHRQRVSEPEPVKSRRAPPPAANKASRSLASGRGRG
ncbi:MAG: Wzz/FepE/Etk N-terminal domain-containing protein [Actinomycetota bacterium]|nr:Wzz/FepE/Etk N-terminal domain-containing protein [Actinomycetota bacterium]